MHHNRSLWIWVASLALVTGCGGTPPPSSSDAADARLAAPRSEVPKASDLVKQAEQKIQAGDAEGAKSLLEQAIASDGGDARAHLDLGIANEMLGDAEAAKAAYRAAIDVQGDLAEALNNLGVLLRDGGELQEAIGLLQRAAEANAGSASVQMNLALALEDAGDGPGARKAYERALSIKPDEVMTRANLGLLLLAMGEADEAQRQLQQAMRSAKDNRAALLAIGNGLRRSGEPKLAVQAMQAAVKAGGEAPTPALLSELALAQRAADDRDGAIATLGEALALDAKYATAHYLLGNMHAGAKRFGEARKHYKAYLKLDPGGPHAERATERLGKLPK